MKVFERVSADFLLDTEQQVLVTSKYVSIRDAGGKEIASTELYQIGFETEDGDECTKEGELL
jgi:hypothetical protein